MTERHACSCCGYLYEARPGTFNTCPLCLWTERYACPCCGYLTLPEAPPGTYDICPVCFWEDDPYQFENPTEPEGANVVSLEEARDNYRRFAVSYERFRPLVRPPLREELPERPAQAPPRHPQ